MKLGIVDTPGFGDTRGFAKDKENVKNIVDKVNQVKYIHCIGLIINGTESRMSQQLKYVVSEISAILSKATISNILVVFTNVESKRKANFKIRMLTEALGRDMPESNSVSLDNPYCLFQDESSDISDDVECDFIKACDALHGFHNAKISKI